MFQEDIRAVGVGGDKANLKKRLSGGEACGIISLDKTAAKWE